MISHWGSRGDLNSRWQEYGVVAPSKWWAPDITSPRYLLYVAYQENSCATGDHK